MKTIKVIERKSAEDLILDSLRFRRPTPYPHAP